MLGFRKSVVILAILPQRSPRTWRTTGDGLWSAVRAHHLRGDVSICCLRPLYDYCWRREDVYNASPGDRVEIIGNMLASPEDFLMAMKMRDKQLVEARLLVHKLTSCVNLTEESDAC